MDIALNHFLQQNQFRAFLRRNGHNPRKDTRHLHGGKLQLSITVLLGYQGTQIQSLIANQGKRPGRIYRHGCENRVYIVRKVMIYIGGVLFAQILMMTDQVQAVLQKLGQKRSVVGVILLPYQPVGLLVHPHKLFFRGHPRNIPFLVTGVHHVL